MRQLLALERIADDIRKLGGDDPDSSFGRILLQISRLYNMIQDVKSLQIKTTGLADFPVEYLRGRALKYYLKFLGLIWLKCSSL